MLRHHVNAVVEAHTGMVVQSGPFTGMVLVKSASWGDGDLSPKLLGVYEEELHSYIREFLLKKYDSIIDVGCAEGYYAVGFALLFSNTPVYAFDVDPRARDVLVEAGSKNGVADRIIVGAFCDPDQLAMIRAKHRRNLLVLDCEGYENILLTHESSLKSLESSDLIVECHDFIDPATTGRLVTALSPTHTVEIVYASGRNPNAFSFLSYLHDNDRWMAVSENRPCTMNWLICKSRHR